MKSSARRVALAPSFEQIEPAFAELRDFVLNDLQRIVSQEVGGNYAAAALISSAYEEVARLREQAKHVPFGDRLPVQWRPVAKSLYGALRNGLVHHYDPKLIVVDDRRVELCLSWRERPHLSLEGARLYLNVQRMADDLRRTFDDYEQALRADATLRDRFQSTRKDREEHVSDQYEAEAWRALLGSAGKEGSPAVESRSC
jgi:hypothetical protein